jgi:hypothetical protein
MTGSLKEMGGRTIVNAMSAEVDDAILACAWPRWMKVARLLGDVSARLAAPVDEPRFEEIAGRIQALAAAGQLESQGNLSRWRYSEVRLPQSETCQSLPTG